MSNEPYGQPAPGPAENHGTSETPGQPQQDPYAGQWPGQYPPPGVPGYGPGGYPPPYMAGYGAPGTGWVYGPPPAATPGGWPGPAGPGTGSKRRGRRALAIAGGVTALLVVGTAGGFIGDAIGSSGTAGGFTGATAPFRPGSGSGGASSGGFGQFPPGGFGQFPSGGFGQVPSGGSSGGSSSSSAGSGPANASSIAAHVDPGLVDVNTTVDYGRARGAGTGMVLTPGGVVLTNNHVIDGATSISVTDVGNGKTYRAYVVGYDQSRDVAILRLSGAAGLRTVTVAPSARVAAGQKVVGIGNAGGVGGTPSYAGGTVTATGQNITAADDLTGTSERLTGMIGTNANIQAGDSGGPLVNTAGQVIGMDTAGGQGPQVTAQQTGDGFAIPIGVAEHIATQLLDAQPAAGVHAGPTAFLGIQIAESGTGRSGSGNGFGGTPAPVSGVRIAGVVPGDPAARAGLSAGDVITSVGGHPVSSQSSLQHVIVNDLHPGQSVAIGYTTRAGQQHSVSVILASGPPA
jgi:S1-C subfamily serine protease